MDCAPDTHANFGGDDTMTGMHSAVLARALAILLLTTAAAAQTPVTGAVVDQSGGAVSAARVTARDGDGRTIDSTTTDAAGHFVLGRLTPGRYGIEVEAQLFEVARVSVDVPGQGSLSELHLTLRVPGLAESTVVTGRRIESRLSETPQKVEIIDASDIERTVAGDITDVLKKNAGVDVVQYSGVLSGVGIRGFRPETSGINKRSLLLIDGRPSGVTNLSTFTVDRIERIEVLKGPASAIYGASAMGGVINVITRQSRGAVTGSGRIGVGSFGAVDVGGAAGGKLLSKVDFDVAGELFDQRDNFRMGNGIVRPATTYRTYDGSGRLGVDLSRAIRLDGSITAYRGRDINTPGDVFSGTASQGRKNLERSSADVRLSAQSKQHAFSGTFFRADEDGHTSNVTTSNPADLPFLPYLTFENALSWTGAQARDAWAWSRSSTVLIGLDYEHVTSESRSFARTGAAQAPFSADNRKNTIGVYAENTLLARQGRTVLSFGGRVDRISVETVDTPFKTNFTPSTTAFTVFNPSVGVKQEIAPGLRLHATAGRAFVPADAAALTGYTTNIVGGRVQINQGNADLEPEHSVSVDGGIEWLVRATHLDATYFRTRIEDRVVSGVLLSNPPAPDPIVLTAVNALASRIRGMDFDVSHRLSRTWSVSANATHYFSRREQLPGSGERNILNVPTNSVRVAVDLDWARLAVRTSGRYVQGRQDQDFNLAGSPVVDYPNFTVIDASASYRLRGRQALVVSINNLFDTFYYEKKGYPLAGASWTVKYRIGR